MENKINVPELILQQFNRTMEQKTALEKICFWYH